MIKTVRADELRPGDVFSTNGATVESVVLCQGGGYADEIAVCFSFEDGTQRFDYVEPNRPVHLWIEDPRIPA